jgi:hypothetical protein
MPPRLEGLFEQDREEAAESPGRTGFQPERRALMPVARKRDSTPRLAARVQILLLRAVARTIYPRVIVP